MTSTLDELAPEDEVKQDEHNNITRKEDCVIVVLLVEVVEDGVVQLVEQFFVGPSEVDVFELLILDEPLTRND